ncbi:MAG: endolytic transglycosylase MltG [Caulobacter sp.]|nr:endolytic transglycosylase MltG [Caulobacter sp.]
MSKGERPGGLSALRRLMIMGFSALLTLAMVLALVAAWALWTYQGPGLAAKDGKTHVVVLRRGSGLNEIASALEKAGIVRSAPVFLAAAQITGAARELKAGEYEFPSKAPMSRVLNDIRKGKVVRHQVTIPEGWTSEMVVELLMKQDALTGEVATPPEGSILPETYDYERGEERAAVLQRMMDDRDRLLATLWEKRKGGLPIRTPEEAVILASIVEKETGLASERPRVAAVFINRLNRGMRLESDPTIIYGLTKGRPLGRGIRRSELERPNPYSTYQIDGLPPTPIANPGRASLAAVLDPPDTDEIFFVADGTGGHVFSSTLEEHNRNVLRWRGVEQQKSAEHKGAEAEN